MQQDQRPLRRTRPGGRSMPGFLGILAIVLTVCLVAGCALPGSTSPQTTAHSAPSRQVNTPSTAAPKSVTPGPNEVIIGSDGRAIAPRGAPKTVETMVAAANHIVDRPYRLGGGHAQWEDSGYDGSGATSYVLHAAGLLAKPLTAEQFRTYGISVPTEPTSADKETTPGWWVKIFVCANGAHMKIGNVEFDAHSDSAIPDGTARTHWRAMHDAHTGCIASAPVGL